MTSHRARVHARDRLRRLVVGIRVVQESKYAKRKRRWVGGPGDAHQLFPQQPERHQFAVWMRMIALIAAALAWASASMCPQSPAPRAAVRMAATEVKSWYDAGRRLADPPPETGLVAKTAMKRPKLTLNQQINRRIVNSDDSEAVLCVVEEHAGSLNSINIATALHRIAARNKHKRARRDSLLRDRRFLLLEDALAAHSSAEAQSIDGAARSVADVLWSYATLGSSACMVLAPHGYHRRAVSARQLAPCASSGRAWRLRAAWYSQSEAPPLALPPPRGLKRAASKVAHFTAFDPPGRVPPAGG